MKYTVVVTVHTEDAQEVISALMSCGHIVSMEYDQDAQVTTASYSVDSREELAGRLFTSLLANLIVTYQAPFAVS